MTKFAFSSTHVLVEDRGAHAYGWMVPGGMRYRARLSKRSSAMPYLTELSPGAQRLVHALFAAVIAVYLAFPVSALLDVAFGPFSNARLRQIFHGSAAVAFVGLMWFNHGRQKRAAERKRLGLAGPPGGAGMMVTGLIALALSAMSLYIAIAPGITNRPRALEAFAAFLAGGIGALGLGARRIRARRQWRREKAAGTVRPGD